MTDSVSPPSGPPASGVPSSRSPSDSGLQASRARWLDGVLCALGALLVYALLGQDRFYLYDGETFYMSVARGETRHFAHVLYMPLVAGFARFGEVLGMKLFDAMTLASGVGAALGVLLHHRAAAVLGAGRGGAVACALAVAGVPAVVFFATVIEVHGVFFAFAGLAWWAAAHAVRSPSLGRCAVFAVATGLAASVHASGHLLAIAVALFVVAQRPEVLRPRTLLAWGAVGALAHGAVWAGLVALVGGEAGSSGSESARVVLERLTVDTLPHLPWTVCNEWLLPFAPVSLAAVAALFRPRFRREALALHVALIPYLALAFVYLGPQIIEHGAYFLPMALPATWLAFRQVGARVLGAGALLGLALGIGLVWEHEAALGQEVVVADVMALVEDRPAAFILSDHREATPVLREHGELLVVRIETMVEQQVGMTDEQAFLQFDQSHVAATAGGGTVFLSERARQVLVDLDHRLLRHLEARYELERVQSGSFTCFEIRLPH